MQKLEVGQLVVSIQGRDAGRFYVVTRLLDEELVMVSDGFKRPLSKPKQKNIKHLKRYNKAVSDNLANRLELKKASDKELKSELGELTKLVDHD